MARGFRPLLLLAVLLAVLVASCHAEQDAGSLALDGRKLRTEGIHLRRPLTFGFGPHKMHHCHDCDDDDDKEDDDKEDDDKDDDKKDKKKKKKKDDKKKKKKDKKKKDKKKKKKKDDDKKKDDSKDNSKDGKGVTVKVQNNLVNEDVEASGSDD